MCSLNSCNLPKSAKELIFYLPESVRPKLLSQLVTEQVSVEVRCDLDLSCPFYRKYYERVHSARFSKVSMVAGWNYPPLALKDVSSKGVMGIDFCSQSNTL